MIPISPMNSRMDGLKIVFLTVAWKKVQAEGPWQFRVHLDHFDTNLMGAAGCEKEFR